MGVDKLLGLKKTIASIFTDLGMAEPTRKGFDVFKAKYNIKPNSGFTEIFPKAVKEGLNSSDAKIANTVREKYLDTVQDRFAQDIKKEALDLDFSPDELKQIRTRFGSAIDNTKDALSDTEYTTIRDSLFKEKRSNVISHGSTEYNELYDEVRTEAKAKLKANEDWVKSENDAVEAFTAEKNLTKEEIRAQQLDDLSLQAEGIKGTDTIVSNTNNVPVDQQTPIKNLQKYDSYFSPDGLPNPNNTPAAMDIFGKNGKAGYSGVQAPITNGATIANTPQNGSGVKIKLTQQEQDLLATGEGDPVEIMKNARARAQQSERAASAQSLGLSKESQDISDLMLQAEGATGTETVISGPGKYKRTTQEAWDKQWGRNTASQTASGQDALNEANEKFAYGVKVALGAVTTFGVLSAALSSSRGQQNNAQLYGQQPIY